MQSSWNWKTWTTALALAAALSSSLDAQDLTPKVAGCATAKDVTACNWPAFKKVLASTNVVTLEYGKLDRPAGVQLRELAKKLGKTVATSDSPGQLTFTVVPASDDGVHIGSADEELVQLRIFNGPKSSGPMLWFESFRGQADRPWLSNVNAVIRQFESHLTKP